MDDSDCKGVSVAFDAPTQHRLAGEALIFQRGFARSGHGWDVHNKCTMRRMRQTGRQVEIIQANQSQHFQTA